MCVGIITPIFNIGTSEYFNQTFRICVCLQKDHFVGHFRKQANTELPPVRCGENQSFRGGLPQVQTHYFDPGKHSRSGS